MPSQEPTRMAYVPTFSLGERDERWASVRARMYHRDIDALLVWGSDYNRGLGNACLRYLTHVPASARGVGIFPLEGDPVVFSEFHHQHEPHSLYDLYQNWVADTRPIGDRDVIIADLRERGLVDGDSRIGVVGFGHQFSSPFYVPYTEIKKIMAALPETEFVEATDLVQRDRLVKSDEQIELLREAGAVAREMVEAMMDAEPGQKECEVYADMIHAQIASGGEPYVFNFFDSGSPTSPDPQHLLHGKPEPLAPSQRPLEDGDLLITEFHAGRGGPFVGVEKGVTLGSAPDELLDVHDVSLQCLENALDTIRPGARFGDVVDAIRAPARETDMSYVELGLHGHGFGSPEFPSAVYPTEPTETYPEGMAEEPLSERHVSGVRLREGMVFGLNIDVHDPNWRDDVGLMFGDTVLVTENGCDPLVDTPRDLVV